MLQINQQLNIVKSSDKDLQIPTCDEKRRSITRFEDLSNELIYEMFDFLDACHMHESFSNLNIRFEDFMNCSSLPLKINLSFISRRTFQHRCTHVVTPNIHRILSLSLSNHLSIEFFLTMFTIDSSFIRLESLTLNDIKRDKFVPLLTRLASLPRLFSLSIRIADVSYTVEDAGVLYHLIFRLPVLKYVNFSIMVADELIELPISDNDHQQNNSIEHLVIDDSCRHIDQLSAILSYVPRLRHLSCDDLCASERIGREILIVPSQLTHISIKCCWLSFDEFELFIFIFCPHLQLLRITQNCDNTYLVAERWERLISHHMPHLRIFDFQHIEWVKTNDEYNAYHTMIDKFSSSFWLERQWFFAHQHYTCSGSRGALFYSTQPFRKTSYEICERPDNETCSYREIGVNFSQKIITDGHRMLPNYLVQCPCITELVVNGDGTEGKDWLIADLKRIVPLAQITLLRIRSSDFHVAKLIEILVRLPNLDLLEIDYEIRPQIDPWFTEQQAQIAHLMSKSKITKLMAFEWSMYPLELVRFLIDLCPRLNYLQISITDDILELIVQLVLSKNANESGHNLFWLDILYISRETVEKLQTMINDKKESHDDYSIEYAEDIDCLYLWR